MGKYLNSRVPFEVYKEIAGTRFFVDKSLLLEDISSAMEVDGQKYLCITRPRRFGKSIMASMIATFLGKAVDSKGGISVDSQVPFGGLPLFPNAVPNVGFLEFLVDIVADHQGDVDIYLAAFGCVLVH